MRAVVQDRYGEAEVLRPAEIPVPVIGPDEVLVRVRAAGVEQGVWHLMAGRPYLVRLAIGLRAPRTPVRGRELAGVVEAVGEGVTAFRPGDEVFGIGEGTFAELVRAKAAKLALKPAESTFEQAAVMSISGLTALQALRDNAKVREGQSVLVIGASGGVGTFAVQIAKALGGQVTGMCGPGKVDLVRSLGVDALDYRAHDITEGGRRYDVVIDIGGNRTLRHLRRALAPRGVLVIVGGETDGRWLGGFGRTLRAPLVSLFVRQRLGGLIASERADDLVALAGMVSSGTVRPVVDRVFPLAETADAIRYLRAGGARGKLVISVAG
nr:NAD(P)-dependent alcohol dehydrogenase [Actinokineospora enzanensis]